MNATHWHLGVIFANCSCTCKLAQTWHSLMNIIREYLSTSSSINSVAWENVLVYCTGVSLWRSWSVMASQTPNNSIAFPTNCSGLQQRKPQSFGLLSLLMGIHGRKPTHWYVLSFICLAWFYLPFLEDYEMFAHAMKTVHKNHYGREHINIFRPDHTYRYWT